MERTQQWGDMGKLREVEHKPCSYVLDQLQVSGGTLGGGGSQGPVAVVQS